MSRLQRQSLLGGAVLLLIPIAVGITFALKQNLEAALGVGFTPLALLSFVQMTGSKPEDPRITEPPGTWVWSLRMGYVGIVVMWLYLEWHLRNGFPTIVALPCLAALYWLHRRTLGPAPSAMPQYDEREQAVLTRALRCSAQVFWVLFVLSGTFMAMKFRGQSVPASLFLGQILLGGWVIGATVCLAILWEERRWPS